MWDVVKQLREKLKNLKLDYKNLKDRNSQCVRPWGNPACFAFGFFLPPPTGFEMYCSLFYHSSIRHQPDLNKCCRPLKCGGITNHTAYWEFFSPGR